MKTELDKVRQRTIQYWYVDGLAELSFGALCLILGLYFYAQATLPEESLLANLLNMGFVVVVIGGSLLVGRIQSYLKSRITYPRTGYVGYQRTGTKHRWIGGLLSALIGVLVAGLLVSAPASLAWMPGITGFLFAAVLVYLGIRTGLVRFYLLSLAALLIGSWLALSGFGDILGLAYFYMLMSMALFLSGGVRLGLYLKSTQVEDAQ
jgi:hypothetical protein